MSHLETFRVIWSNLEPFEAIFTFSYFSYFFYYPTFQTFPKFSVCLSVFFFAKKCICLGTNHYHLKQCKKNDRNALNPLLANLLQPLYIYIYIYTKLKGIGHRIAWWWAKQKRKYLNWQSTTMHCSLACYTLKYCKAVLHKIPHYQVGKFFAIHSPILNGQVSTFRFQSFQYSAPLLYNLTKN